MGSRVSRNVRVRPSLITGGVVVVLAAIAIAVWWRTDVAKNNVIVIVTDTVRRDALGCYGNPLSPTPHIDAVAADGVRFEQAISTSGWTLPAVASLLTGTWPTLHGGSGRQIVLTPIRDEVPTVAEVLAPTPFKTLAIANAAFFSPMLHLDRGFDVFDHEYTYNWDARRADRSIDAALALIDRFRRQPKFLLVHLFDPHLDYDPPGEYATRYTDGRREPGPPLDMQTCLDMCVGPDQPPTPEDVAYVRELYLGEVAFMDAQIGRLIDKLRKMGIYETSTLVIVADHGEEFWDHGGFEHGHTLYDELTRVPLIIKPPQGIPVARSVVGSQVRLIDIAPTIFDLLGVKQPPSFIGQSLLPYVNGERDDNLPAFSESTLYGPIAIALRASRYKYIRSLDAEGNETGELYDWRQDPHDGEDLATREPAIADAMRDSLFDFYDDLDEQAQRMSKPAPVDMSPQRIKMLRSLGYIR